MNACRQRRVFCIALLVMRERLIWWSIAGQSTTSTDWYVWRRPALYSCSPRILTDQSLLRQGTLYSSLSTVV